MRTVEVHRSLVEVGVRLVVGLVCCLGGGVWRRLQRRRVARMEVRVRREGSWGEVLRKVLERLAVSAYVLAVCFSLALHSSRTGFDTGSATGGMITPFFLSVLNLLALSSISSKLSLTFGRLFGSVWPFAYSPRIGFPVMRARSCSSAKCACVTC